MLALTACSGPGNVGQAAVPAGDCGIVPQIAPQDIDGAVKELPEDIQASYNGFPAPVYASTLTEFTKKAGPYTVGWSYPPVQKPQDVALEKALEESFDQAKAAGLVEGELIKKILPDPATMTPADQIRDYQDLVRSGADIVLITPLSGEAMVDAVKQAAAAGVATISLTGTIPTAEAINIEHNQYLNIAEPTAEVVKQLNGQGNVILVRGFPGLSMDQQGINAAQTVFKNCSEIAVLGEVVGGSVNATAKSALTQFLASHPQKVDAVVQIGVMGAGVYSAFEELGRPAPKVIDSLASAASLAHWEKNARDSGYETAGTAANGTLQGKAQFYAARKLMEGAVPIVNEIVAKPAVITSDNLNEYLVPGAGTDSVNEVLDGERWLPPEVMDKFFR